VVHAASGTARAVRVAWDPVGLVELAGASVVVALQTMIVVVAQAAVD